MALLDRESSVAILTGKPSLMASGVARPDSRISPARPNGPMYLDKNENVDPDLASWYDSILPKIPLSALSSYPDLAGVYNGLSKWLNVPLENLALTTGCDGAIHQTFEIFIDSGDKVLLTQPTFAMYPVYAASFGTDVTPLIYQRGPNGPTLSIEKILIEIIRIKPRVFFLPNPDSPTGTTLTLEELTEIADNCLAVGTILFIDEAYHPFADVDASTLALRYPNVIVARTFSKAWGLAGLRVGYVVGAKQLVEWYHVTRPMYEIGAFPAQVVQRVLENPEVMRESVARIADGKTYFTEEMRKLGFKVLPSGGNFVHVSFGNYAEKIHQALRDVVLYRLDFSEDCLKGYSRFSMAPVSMLTKVVDVIAMTCKE